MMALPFAMAPAVHLPFAAIRLRGRSLRRYVPQTWLGVWRCATLRPLLVLGVVLVAQLRGSSSDMHSLMVYCPTSARSWLPQHATLLRRSAIRRHALNQDILERRAKATQENLRKPGDSSDEQGFKDLCTRWNREEAENVANAKRVLQSATTTRDAKLQAIDELEYWAIRRGGYDAEIILIGMLRSQDKELAGHAHISLKKQWGSHFNAWVNNKICLAKRLQQSGRMPDAMTIYDRTIFENPLWGEGYHLRAKCWNQQGCTDKTLKDLRNALEYCPNNYVVMVELALLLMGQDQLSEAGKLMHEAEDLCPLLPIEAFKDALYSKAPHLKDEAEAARAAAAFTPDAPPQRLMPDFWIERREAVDRPNQAFLRVGAELEQWFSDMRDHQLTRAKQRKLWSRLVIAWDPDKHTRELRSFTTQVHEALKSRRERELEKVNDSPQPSAEAQPGDVDPAEFLRRIRRERRG